MPPKAHAKLKTSVSIVPIGSQVAIISLIFVSAMCLCVTFFFIWHNKDFLIPLISASAIFLVAIVLWFRSHRDIDQGALPPTTIADSDGLHSTSISFHPRSMESDMDLDALGRVVSAMRLRSILPQPDGLVDDEGREIPNSQDEAQGRIDAINEETRAIHQFLSRSRSPDTADGVAQFPPQLSGLPHPNSLSDGTKPDDKS